MSPRCSMSIDARLAEAGVALSALAVLTVCILGPFVDRMSDGQFLFATLMPLGMLTTGAVMGIVADLLHRD